MTFGAIHIAAIVVVLIALAFGLLLRGLATPNPGIAKKKPQGEFSARRYRPMLRLLDEEDFEFLASQPGFEEQLGRRLRAERRMIFHKYLDQLSADFSYLHRAARWMLLTSPEPDPEFERVLIEQRLQFARSMMRVRFRLYAHAWGLSEVPTLDLRKLVETFESLQREVVPAASRA